MNRFFTTMLVSLFAMTHSATAAIDETIRLKETIEINAPADKVWAKVGSFADMSWHPAIAKTELNSGKADEVGATRVLTTQDGGKINEVLTSFDATSMTMKYEITESVLPVREYGATLKVEAAGDGKSIVTWRAMFKRKDPANPGAKGQDDEAAKAAIDGIFKSGLQNLKKISE
ncbi:MAG: SRPBCC family protein [Methylotenera sp.]|jgi:mxaD protein|uniref:SRPBCC family protein n=1 Tax=Methylotenera sp. TaxID=2051956 RepID=UPI00271C18C9|nr:SRPBCC family protein [Methylotenera sp.]MDO9392948.1 SRPBCC family protein [Methylotenera sp.]MDP1522600.1 SRPBCC family protein [Methylotenera sp.]MDZ4212101.1 SRPBCC family protein [Methylotenera sp.]